MIIRTLVKKGFDHPVYCEDDLFFSEHGKVYIGAIFDGCSTGIKSHFASSLYGKVLGKVWRNTLLSVNEEEMESYSLNVISISVFNSFFVSLCHISDYLRLDSLEILSTMILCVIKNNDATILVSGDGCILVDGNETKIESLDNTPDYLAYHLNDGSLLAYGSTKQYKFKDFKDLSICSDGIYSFTNKDKKDMSEEVKNSLLLNKDLIKSEAMLARKYNLLLKQGYSNYDDLSIVRFINESI